jgi:nicotinamide mononucleotide transporter
VVWVGGCLCLEKAKVMINKWIWVFLAIASCALFISSFQNWVPISTTEVLGFITGAVCVLLVVDLNVWNFPIGIANNIFFIVLFFSSQLYGDMTLQFIYIILATIGWWQWLHGGVDRTKLPITYAHVKEIIVLVLLGTFSTYGLWMYFIKIKDSAPFLDALTTVLSLLAQYLLNGKRLQNWYFWIVADIIYVGLYIQKDLYLTAILYAFFIGFCIVGFINWRKSMIEYSKVIFPK